MREQSPVREAGATSAFLRSYFPEKLAGLPDDHYLQLVEAEMQTLKKELKLERRRLKWLLGAAFLAGILVGWAVS
eukprot:SAG22_NODE_6029_length_913_cov_1.497543_1_plen_75_part_00